MSSGDDSTIGKYAWLIDTVFDEIMDEAQKREMNDEKLQAYLTQFGQLLAWCGTGDERLLPPELRDYLWEKRPELLGIGSGESVSTAT